MKQLITDALWQRLEPLLPPPPQRRFRFPGRKPLDYRKILTGILFVLKTGIAWEDLPAELGCGCGKSNPLVRSSRGWTAQFLFQGQMSLKEGGS
jgi:transposase